MQRDMDVIRQIVLALNAAEGSITAVDGLDVRSYRVHAQLLIEAGLAHGVVRPSGMSHAVPEGVRLDGLTWAGHEFAQAVRDDTLWNKAKVHVLKPSAAWTFDVLLKYLGREIGRVIPGLDQLV